MQHHVLCAVLLMGCSAAATDVRSADRAPTPTASYEATWTERGELDVVVRASGGFDEIALEPGAEAYVSGLSVEDANGKPAAFALDRWLYHIPACTEACTIRYRIALSAIADAFDNPEFAGRVGGALFAPPTTWLLHPLGKPEGTFELSVRVPDGVEHVSGLVESGEHRYAADLADLPQAPYAAFGELRRRRIALQSGSIDLAIAGLTPDVGDEGVEAWVRSAATSVESYLGKFPVQRAAVFVIVEQGQRVGHGTALGNGGSSILVRVGAQTTPEAFAQDWIMTHEVVHLSMPGLHARHNWLEEGLATYVEPVARAQRGLLSAEQVWAEWFFDMRQGLPTKDDGGLDGTSSWGRTYWGGAIFWLLADVAIREKTQSRFTLRDCLRGTMDAGGNIAVRWSASKFIERCDAALPEPIVRPLYDAHAQRAVGVDLDGLFSRLGVRRSRSGVELDDAAPAAALRRGITGAEERVATRAPGGG
jgi:hypothetical protein